MKKGLIRIQRIGSDLREGRYVADEKFDLILTTKARGFSSIHWTPIEVARTASDLIRKLGRPVRSPCRERDSGNENFQLKVLDVGSGAGKFCLVSGHLEPDLHFTGIEQRGELVDHARRMVEAFELENVAFLHGNALDADWAAFDAIYLFNPFYENILPAIQMGDGVSYSEETYRRHVSTTEEKLQDLAPGALLVTYHGFGGEPPRDFEQLESVFVGSAYVEVWRKVEPGSALSANE